ncbi:Rieske 2Fe-2S domain-containing protein [Bradyrhizobium cajani]|uniref:Rieske 2Fe-2S domain-containing protein n=1 Tax=Bradyrhizobium cajani TaxID=1928661 RepID=A0A844TCR1_9BRAD|nr:Rieske 2Fe-2S domain-containing protein [Bradyrhizobium cajani]
MNAPKPFPLNAWYAAAWSHEIARELSARTICGKNIVLYRRTDGAIAALEDACWHRLLPLSLGHLKGDDVMCGYHGLVFNSAGRCSYMPAQKTINPSACVRAYPVAERHYGPIRIGRHLNLPLQKIRFDASMRSLEA